MTDDLPPRAPVPGDTPTDSLPTAVDIARRAVRTGIRVSPSVAAELLEEYDRRAAEIEQRRAALCRALAIPDHTPWEAALESARSAGVVRDAEYRTRDRVEAENTRLRAALDAVDGPVLDGVHALALGSIARDVGLTADASGALVALTVADRMEELARLRGQRAAVLALHRNDLSGDAAPVPPGMCEVCMHEWPCPTARTLSVEEDGDA